MSKKIYVGNLPFSATEESVKNLFSQFGEVVSVNIIIDRETGRSRGFCFVDMENADAAIAGLNEKEFEGRKLRINEAKEQVPRKRNFDGPSRQDDNRFSRDRGDNRRGGSGGYNRDNQGNW